MRLPRMTTRRWMILVAIVSLILGCFVGVVRVMRRHAHFSDPG